MEGKAEKLKERAKHAAGDLSDDEAGAAKDVGDKIGGSGVDGSRWRTLCTTTASS